MLWLTVSLVGLSIVFLTIQHAYKENKDISNDKKKRGIFLLFFLIASAAGESTILYLGLLLILFGMVKASGLL
ncbi:hypothetical protein [Bacillus taeanensis]|uniref:Uncharacterized protein n=1 Tax=Bacillus taeanensis TaxID=273032 RepID=A0A366XZM4_9BACI|nr:hypothetical protein [Bacillus taeanensis]RBW69614.1 hypothetical protein DS031_10315 [Bacillus taeanensis]